MGFTNVAGGFNIAELAAVWQAEWWKNWLVQLRGSMFGRGV
jgi:hypothetical protein